MSDRQESVDERISLFASKLGLNELAARVLSCTYMGMNLTLGTISSLVGEKESKVSKVVEKLVEQGLLARVDGIVTVYHPVLPLETLIQHLDSTSVKIKSLTKEANTLLSRETKRIAANRDSLSKATGKAVGVIRDELRSLETSLDELLDREIENALGIVSNAIDGFSGAAGAILENARATQDETFEVGLASLREELDGVKESFAEEATRLVEKFEDDLKTRHREFEEALDGLRKTNAAFAEVTQKVLLEAYDTMGVVIQDIWADLTQGLESSTAESIGRVRPLLEKMLGNINSEVADFREGLRQAYLRGMGSLSQLVESARQLYKEPIDAIDVTLGRVSEMVASSRDGLATVRKNIEASLASSSESLKNAFNKILDLDRSYRRSVLDSLDRELSQISSILDSRHSTLAELAGAMSADLRRSISNTREEVARAIQAQYESELQRSEEVRDSVVSELDAWSKSLSQGVHKELDIMLGNIDSTMSKRSAEVQDLARNTGAKMTSSFEEILSEFETNRSVALEKMKGSVQDLESELTSTTSSVLSDYENRALASVESLQEDYERLHKLVEKRVAESISSILAHADKAQKSLESSMDRHIDALNRHSATLRDEFHTHAENITAQFLKMVQDVEKSLDTLISSQVARTSEMLSSMDIEFKNMVKAEVKALKAESADMQHEYAALLNQKLTEASESILETRKDLQKILQDQNARFSAIVGEAVTNLESLISTTEAALRQESGSVSELSNELIRLSTDTQHSLERIRQSIGETFSMIEESLRSSVDKQISSVRSIVDAFFAESHESRKKALSDILASVDRITTESISASGAALNSYQSKLTESEAESGKILNKVREDVTATMAKLESEASGLLGTESVTISKSIEKTLNGLATMTADLDNKVHQLHRDFEGALVDLKDGLAEQGERGPSLVEELSRSFLDHTVEHANKHADNVESVAVAEVNRGIEILSGLQRSITDTVSDIGLSLTVKTGEGQGTLIEKTGAVISKYQKSAESTMTHFDTFLNDSENRIRSMRDQVASSFTNSLDSASALTARRFESAAHGVKEKFGSKLSQLDTDLRMQVDSTGPVLREKLAEVKRNAGDGISESREKISRALDDFKTDTDRALTEWSSESANGLEKAGSAITETAEKMDALISDSVSVLSAIGQVIQALARKPDKSWFVRGADEIKAHILEMAARATKSIIISVPDVRMLDMGHLAAIEVPDRRVLLLPAVEGASQVADQLPGWMVWEHETPPVLALRDGEEIVIAGSEMGDDTVALVSTDPVYLRLFHDVIGPRLVGRSRSRKLTE
ncbi:MAG: hypothetical protein QXS20_00150 [Candidatus Thorarchaeota archaeon]